MTKKSDYKKMIRGIVSEIATADDIFTILECQVPGITQDDVLDIARKKIKQLAEKASLVASYAIWEYVDKGRCSGEIVWEDDRISPDLIAKYVKKKLRICREKAIVRVSGRRVFVRWKI